MSIQFAVDYSMINAWRHFWCSHTLARRFTALGLALSFLGTFMIGSWVAQEVEQGILSRKSGAAALYVSEVLAPMVQGLTSNGGLSKESVRQLDAFVETAAPRFRIMAITLWSEDGRILYGGDRKSVALDLESNANLTRAFSGELSSRVDDPPLELSRESNSGNILIKARAPIYDSLTGHVIAVAEFYENADDIGQVVTEAKLESWAMTSLVQIVNFLAFSIVVRGGSDRIEQQKLELTRHVDDLSRALTNEKALRDRIDRGVRQSVTENERFLKSIGSDLHDGPAQLIGLAMLHLDRTSWLIEDPIVDTIRSALAEAVREIRAVSAGLLLPNLENQGLEESIAATVRNHEMRTRTKVDVSCTNIPVDCPQHVKLCLCRFIQEGLANAFRHAGGLGQRVTIDAGEGFVRAAVSDVGPGMPASYSSENGARLGLSSLRGRLESVRGSLTVGSQPRRGTRLVAWLPLEAREIA